MVQLGELPEMVACWVRAMPLEQKLVRKTQQAGWPGSEAPQVLVSKVELGRPRGQPFDQEAGKALCMQVLNVFKIEVEFPMEKVVTGEGGGCLAPRLKRL